MYQKAPAAIGSGSDVGALGTILGIWAHPDDEAYLSGGLMALARDTGSRVVCVTATRGELGTPDPRAWPPDIASSVTRERGALVEKLIEAAHRQSIRVYSGLGVYS